MTYSRQTTKSGSSSRIGESIGQMDRVTQQNATLVEQMAAAASSLKSLAGDQVDAVSVFKLPGDHGSAGGHYARLLR